MKPIITRDPESFGPIINGPVWPNGCEHNEGTYVCSFEVCRIMARGIEKFDLYLFPNKYHGTEVCIRYGKENNEYISPGGLIEFLAQANVHHNQIYQTAFRILRDHGYVTWTHRKSQQTNQQTNQ